MSAVCILGIVFGGAVICLAMICTTILLIIRIRHGGISTKDREYQTDEARMILEIYQSMSTLESRVDTLETILMEHNERSRKK